MTGSWRTPPDPPPRAPGHRANSPTPARPATTATKRPPWGSRRSRRWRGPSRSSAPGTPHAAAASSARPWWASSTRSAACSPTTTPSRSGAGCGGSPPTWRCSPGGCRTTWGWSPRPRSTSSSPRTPRARAATGPARARRSPAPPARWCTWGARTTRSTWCSWPSPARGNRPCPALAPCSTPSRRGRRRRWAAARRCAAPWAGPRNCSPRTGPTRSRPTGCRCSTRPICTAWRPSPSAPSPSTNPSRPGWPSGTPSGPWRSGTSDGSGRRSSTTSRWPRPASSPTTRSRPTAMRGWPCCRSVRTPPTAPGTGCARCTG
ncbi:hypothetical protein STAL104432_09245 [Streptomyces albus]